MTSLNQLSFYSPVIERRFEDISDESYDAAPGSVLLTSLYILGKPLHLNAIRVTTSEDEGEQRAYDPKLQDELNQVYGLYDYAFVTTEIPGFEGEFVLYAYPHGD